METHVDMTENNSKENENIENICTEGTIQKFRTGGQIKFREFPQKSPNRNFQQSCSSDSNMSIIDEGKVSHLPLTFQKIAFQTGKQEQSKDLSNYHDKY